jgi:hypothetical protein
MFASPALFERMGWRGVARLTPSFMLWAGVPFFAGCIAYNWLLPGALPPPQHSQPQLQQPQPGVEGTKERHLTRDA